MELVFEIVSAQQFVPGQQASKRFKQAGGSIGRHPDCDWPLPDAKRVISARHALVSFREGAYYLTDTSSNGTLRKGAARLPKQQAQRIAHGDTFCLGDFEIRARLVQDPARFDGVVGLPVAAGSLIPDDAFLDLDPLVALDQQAHAYLAQVEPQPVTSALQPHDHLAVELHQLPLPQLVAAVAAPAPQPARPAAPNASFWEAFAGALGVPFDTLDAQQREALALQVARLLRQCIAGLQQGLHTRDALKRELRLPLGSPPAPGSTALQHAADPASAMHAMLGLDGRQPLAAEQILRSTFHELQAHQLALVAASQAAVTAVLAQFAPEQLTQRFDEQHKPLLATAGSRWRAYRRLHRRLQRDDEWREGLLTGDFARSYDEQVRLTATLDATQQG
ncbi:type VI secretion system-associated FHA domain protein TagH [Pseudomonas sp. UL073]|uniref:Type VI secretion system-associated FHA domain protein TagH n=1 Tax=Zestomonas insulae TaxID=2809017 RepID=A0ABS2IJX8_9GAMM|nr:type VI secretion system-associated FHA domain protein TagH [Pseudomonas insulae]MBM7063370.1 type VI secretion system-associated FHA domain protein TagH [Pseudomonas insulae]